MIDLKKDIVLDDAAEKLYQMLGGVDTSNRVEPGLSLSEKEGLIESLMEQEKQLDSWRCSLVELGHQFGSFFKGVRISGLTANTAAEIDAIIDAMISLHHRIPSQDNSVQIRFRGRRGPGDSTNSESLDYILLTGHLMVDMSVTKGLSKRLGVTATHLPGRLLSTFEEFALLDINNFRISIGAGRQEDLDQLNLSLQILARYFRHIVGGGSLAKNVVQESGAPLVIFNENQQPDPNLTMLAGINRLKRESMQELVSKISEMMNRPETQTGLEQYASVYDAIFAFKKFKDLLTKPLVEVNNVRWLMVNKGQEVVSRGKVQLSRTVSNLYAGSSRKAAQVMESIYGNDYRDIQATDLPANMGNVTDFLNYLQSRGLDPRIRQEILNSIQKGLDRAPDDLLDNLSIFGNRLIGRSEGRETSSGTMNSELLDMFSFFKKRSGTKKKLRRMLHETTEFDTEDLETIARDFEISTPEAKHLIALMQECFSSEGHFNRRTFENSIPEFLKYEKKVFDFLWHYLKEIKSRDDRVAFLNSLQLLIAKMTQPQLALKVLVTDFIRDPHDVGFSDRNALILANILLRKYNKELQTHIELTPEEVLLVRDGLNLEMTQSAVEYIDQDQDRYLQKVRTLHKKLRESIQPKKRDAKPMPLRYLITVEREIFILLSLVGGSAAHKIMRSVVMEYGAPDAFIYSIIQSEEQIKAVFPLLQLTVRGLMRFNDKSDLPVLREIKSREEEFVRLKPGLLKKEVVTRVMEYVEAAITKISAA